MSENKIDHDRRNGERRSFERNRNKAYQWVIGILVALLLAVGGSVMGSMVTAQTLGGDLKEHAALPAHPVAHANQMSIIYRLERMEEKLDRLLEWRIEASQ